MSSKPNRMKTFNNNPRGVGSTVSTKKSIVASRSGYPQTILSDGLILDGLSQIDFYLRWDISDAWDLERTSLRWT